MTAPMTLPGRLVQRMEGSPKAIAIREKKQGVWKETTWTEYYEIVSVMALALKNLGIEKMIMWQFFQIIALNGLSLI